MRRLLLVAMLLGLGAPALGSADDVARSVVLLTKALSYDRNLRARAGAELVIAVIAPPRGDGGLALAKLAHRRLLALEGVTVQGAPIRALMLEVGDIESLREGLENHRVDVLILVGTHLDSELATVAALATEHGVLTASLVPEHVHEALALGVDTRPPRVRLLINRTEASAEGADFSGELLQLAEVIE